MVEEVRKMPDDHLNLPVFVPCAPLAYCEVSQSDSADDLASCELREWSSTQGARDADRFVGQGIIFMTGGICVAFLGVRKRGGRGGGIHAPAWCADVTRGVG